MKGNKLGSLIKKKFIQNMAVILTTGNLGYNMLPKTVLYSMPQGEMLDIPPCDEVEYLIPECEQMKVEIPKMEQQNVYQSEKKYKTHVIQSEMPWVKDEPKDKHGFPLGLDRKPDDDFEYAADYDTTPGPKQYNRPKDMPEYTHPGRHPVYPVCPKKKMENARAQQVKVPGKPWW